MSALDASIQRMIFIDVMPSVHDLATADLNLLRVLGVLLEERHLTRAGKRLGLTQSATSHALARLRRLFADPLFVRTARGVAPTACAEKLAEPVREAMLALERCFQVEEAFVPASAVRSFSLASADYGSFVLAPRLLDRLEREAPNVDLWLRALDGSIEEQLARGGGLSSDEPILTGYARVSYRDGSWRNGVVTLELQDGRVTELAWHYSGPFYIDL